MKDDAIVLVDALDIMRSLPAEMQRDDQIMDSVIESLQFGISKVEARQDALEIAQMKMGEAMAHGFKLVDNEIQAIKHEAEKERIHTTYLKESLNRVYEIATNPKTDNRGDRSPSMVLLAGIAIIGVVGIVAVSALSSVLPASNQKPTPTPISQPSPSSEPYLTCGIEITCIPKNLLDSKPGNKKGGV